MFKEAALRQQSVAEEFSEFNPQECGLIAFLPRRIAVHRKDKCGRTKCGFRKAKLLDRFQGF